MDFQSDMAVLFVAVINVVGVLLFVLINPRTTKYVKKKNMIAGITFLALVLIFDVISMLWFVKNNMADNIVIFVLFFPLMGNLMSDTIKELKSATK